MPGYILEHLLTVILFRKLFSTAFEGWREGPVGFMKDIGSKIHNKYGLRAIGPKS